MTLGMAGGAGIDGGALGPPPPPPPLPLPPAAPVLPAVDGRVEAPPFVVAAAAALLPAPPTAAVVGALPPVGPPPPLPPPFAPLPPPLPPVAATAAAAAAAAAAPPSSPNCPSIPSMTHPSSAFHRILGRGASFFEKYRPHALHNGRPSCLSLRQKGVVRVPQFLQIYAQHTARMPQANVISGASAAESACLYL
jgi:hypothetical protein